MEVTRVAPKPPSIIAIAEQISERVERNGPFDDPQGGDEASREGNSEYQTKDRPGWQNQSYREIFLHFVAHYLA